MAAVPRTGARFWPGPAAVLLLFGHAGRRSGVHARIHCRRLETVKRKFQNRLSIAASYFRHKTVLSGGPVEISLESTAKCNLYCPMCPRHIFTFDTENMALKFYRKII